MSTAARVAPLAIEVRDRFVAELVAIDVQCRFRRSRRGSCERQPFWLSMQIEREVVREVEGVVEAAREHGSS